jgi:hypothetical protein
VIWRFFDRRNATFKEHRTPATAAARSIEALRFSVRSLTRWNFHTCFVAAVPATFSVITAFGFHVDIWNQKNLTHFYIDIRVDCFRFSPLAARLSRDSHRS